MTRDDPTHVSPYLSWAFNPAFITASLGLLIAFYTAVLNIYGAKHTLNIFM